MAFPLKPSPSKSGRLTRQANVINVGAHSNDSIPISDSLLQTLNSHNALILRAELPNPMSRLPEIRLEGGSCGNGSKTQVGQVKPQKSCESYDSTASGMSWSSSQSTMAIGGGCCNSNSASGNPSFTSYEEDEESLHQHQYHHQDSPIGRILSTPGALQRARCSSAQQGLEHTFRKGYSFEDEQAHEEVSDGTRPEVENTIIESSNEQVKEFYDSVFGEQEKEPDECNESAPSQSDTGRKKSFRRFWKLAYKTIKNEGGNKDGNLKSGQSKKKSVSEEKEVEIDPVYQLLKSAAIQRQLSVKNSTASLDQSEQTRRTQPLSSGGRANSSTQRERSQPT